MYCSVPNRLMTLLAAATAVMAISSCRLSSGGTDIFIPAPPDWSDTASWFISIPEESGGTPQADIFYILPTCIWDWKNDDGALSRYSDCSNPEHIQAFRPSAELAEDIFAQDSFGFYCPYYRQISLDVWMDGEDAVDNLFRLSMEDINRAFRYYLDHYNQGRPFVIAGFSQGGKAVVELVKHAPEDVLSRMAAAYAIGYSITEEELEQYPRLHPASDSAGTGSIICYNSVSTPEAACPAVSHGDVCINPVNWSTKAIPAVLDDSVTVTADTTCHLLIVKGLDSNKYYVPSLGKLFPAGNYHLLELTLYREQLKRNTALRIKNFKEQGNRPGKQ